MRKRSDRSGPNFLYSLAKVILITQKFYIRPVSVVCIKKKIIIIIKNKKIIIIIIKIEKKVFSDNHRGMRHTLVLQTPVFALLRYFMYTQAIPLKVGPLCDVMLCKHTSECSSIERQQSITFFTM